MALQLSAQRASLFISPHKEYFQISSHPIEVITKFLNVNQMRRKYPHYFDTEDFVVPLLRIFSTFLNKLRGKVSMWEIFFTMTQRELFLLIN